MRRRALSRLHPLLLERGYWRDRLRVLDSGHPFLLRIPRPDLCTGGLEVEELRLRTHDGKRLYGLLCRSAFSRRDQPCRIRIVPPHQRPDIDRTIAESGRVEIVLQEAPGRRLEDRVLDVMSLLRLARDTEGIDSRQLELAQPETGPLDEFLIANRLLAEGLTED